MEDKQRQTAEWPLPATEATVETDADAAISKLACQVEEEV